jgi:rod shape-determining protein MreD
VKRPDRVRFALLIGVLVLVHFTVRGRFGSERVAPDLLLLALQLFAIRADPGAGALAGFGLGLLRDALTPASFGAGALAHTLVGYLTGWGKALFFAENVVVNGALIFAGTWLRNAVVAVASGTLGGERLYHELLVTSPLQGLTTAAVGTALLLVFRGWPAVRARGV